MIGVVLLVLQFAVVMLRTLDVVFFKRISFFAIGRCFRSWGMPQSCSVLPMIPGAPTVSLVLSSKRPCCSFDSLSCRNASACTRQA